MTQAAIYAGSANYDGMETIAAQLGYYPTVSDYFDATSPAKTSQAYPMSYWSPNVPTGTHFIIGMPFLWTGSPGTTGPPDLTDYPIASILAGDWDSNFETAVSNVFTVDPQGIIRLGWEMNGSSMCWGTSYITAAQFVSLFQHVAAIIHAGGLKVGWNPVLVIGEQNDVTTFWPGADYVDYLGPDCYAQRWCPTAPNPTEPEQWDTLLSQGPGWSGDGSGILTQSLSFYAGMSNYYSIPLLLPEVGCWCETITYPAEGGTGDDPYFISEVGTWITTNNAGIVLWADQGESGDTTGALPLFTSNSPDATAQAISSFQPDVITSTIRFLSGNEQRYRLQVDVS